MKWFCDGLEVLIWPCTAMSGNDPTSDVASLGVWSWLDNKQPKRSYFLHLPFVIPYEWILESTAYWAQLWSAYVWWPVYVWWLLPLLRGFWEKVWPFIPRLLKWRLVCEYLFHSLGLDQSTVVHRTEVIVVKTNQNDISWNACCDCNACCDLNQAVKHRSQLKDWLL